MSDDVVVAEPNTAQEDSTYLVRLEVFEGPLDLLLHLIEAQELDITTVSLAAVTDQYLQYISRLDSLRPDTLADFIVVAAKLLLIKSRALLPAPPRADEAEEDVGDDLVRQLQEYRKLKQLAQLLREREESGLRAYLRVASLPVLEKKLDLSDVTLDDLLAAVQRALAVEPPAPPVDGVVAPVVITIHDQIARIESALARRPSVSFQNLMRRCRSRIEIIVTFLAVLELNREHRIRVQQEHLFGEILILRTLPGEPALAPSAQEPPQE